MSFVQRELKRIAEAMREPRSEDEYRQLYAAQAALVWAADPYQFQGPLSFIRGGKEGDSKDCPACLCQVQSSGSAAQTVLAS